MKDEIKIMLWLFSYMILMLASITSLTLDVDKLEAENKAQTQTIYKQQQEINTLERRIESLGREL